MHSLALYPIYIGDYIAPHYTLQRAFEKYFSPCITFDWVPRKQKIGMKKTQDEFIELLKKERPDYAFLQLQNPENMSVEVVREMAKYTKILNWSGDIRQTDAWYDWFEAIGREIHLTLFSNMTDVYIMRQRGVRADYLQVGYDHNIYFPDWKEKSGPEIVFCANNYGNFQTSKYRIEVAKALTGHFGPRFKLYGSGWDREGIKTHAIGWTEEAELYRRAKIGISVSNFTFERYHSDRLLRIMACGCVPMSHSYPALDQDFVPDTDIVVFENIDELIHKCEEVLMNDAMADRISREAFITVSNYGTWEKRCEELYQVLARYE
jgi:spore maturation protein CgeB